MAWQCLQISRSTLSPSLHLHPHRHPRRLRPNFLRCRLPGDDSPSGDEKPESLFMKELKRRGMTQDGGRRVGEMEREEETGRRSGVAEKEFDKGLLDQRERSMALNSEGLEGLLPRAKLLLTLGGTFFLAFWPLIVTTITIFTAMYFYFGSSFVHDGSDIPASPPPYIDPYALLEDERISKVAPLLK